MPEGLAEGTMRKLRNAAEAGTFRLPERRDETGLRRPGNRFAGSDTDRSDWSDQGDRPV